MRAASTWVLFGGKSLMALCFNYLQVFLSPSKDSPCRLITLNPYDNQNQSNNFLVLFGLPSSVPSFCFLVAINSYLNHFIRSPCDLLVFLVFCVSFVVFFVLYIFALLIFYYYLQILYLFIVADGYFCYFKVSSSWLSYWVYSEFIDEVDKWRKMSLDSIRCPSIKVNKP